MVAPSEPARVKHPLKKGTRVKALLGECDEDFDGKIRETEPGAIGTITGIARGRQDGSEGFAYDLTFKDSEVWVVLDDCDLDDAERFEVL